MPLIKIQRHCLGDIRRIRKFITNLRHLSLHEHQCKTLLRENGCTIQDFFVAGTSEELETNFKNKVWNEYVVKAQILAGGRGKGYFRGGPQGLSGVYVNSSKEKVKSSAINMLNRRLVTKQTNDFGAIVNKIMVAESVSIRRETYLAIVLDRSIGSPIIMASPNGGINIEEVAQNHPELLLKETVDVEIGITNEQSMKVAAFLGFNDSLVRTAASQIRNLYNLFINIDATQVEINPFAETHDDRVFCIDAKFNFDENAHFRQKRIAEMSSLDREEGNSLEERAQKAKLNYIEIDGNIGCIVNGAGLAMATMDIVKINGGEPANFLDIGGGANLDQVAEAFRIVAANPEKVKSIFVNIFGGIMRCDIIAQGLIKAMSELQSQIPIVVRLLGTRDKEAMKLIEDSKLNIVTCNSFQGAAKMAVELSKTSIRDEKYTGGNPYERSTEKRYECVV